MQKVQFDLISSFTSYGLPQFVEGKNMNTYMNRPGMNTIEIKETVHGERRNIDEYIRRT